MREGAIGLDIKCVAATIIILEGNIFKKSNGLVTDESPLYLFLIAANGNFITTNGNEDGFL